MARPRIYHGKTITEWHALLTARGEAIKRKSIADWLRKYPDWIPGTPVPKADRSRLRYHGKALAEWLEILDELGEPMTAVGLRHRFRVRPDWKPGEPFHGAKRASGVKRFHGKTIAEWMRILPELEVYLSASGLRERFRKQPQWKPGDVYEDGRGRRTKTDDETQKERDQ
jgi:hypothetical protein